MHIELIETLPGVSTKPLKLVESPPIVEAFSGGAEIVERIADEWRGLCVGAPGHEPFFRPEWISASVEAFAPEKKLLLLTARVDGRLRGVLPLVEELALFHGLPVRMVRSAVNIHTPRSGLVHDAGPQGREIATTIWQWLKERGRWDVIELRQALQGGASEKLLTAARQDGYRTGQWKLSPSPHLKFPDRAAALEKVIAHTTSKFRYNLRRGRRKLEEQGELRLIRTTEADPAELERFYQLEQSGWKGKEGTAIACDVRTRKFYDQVARSAAQSGYLSLYRLDCGDHTVAMQFGLTYGERFFLLKPAYDENFRHCSPGHVITYETLGDLLARGIREFDFLTPWMEWKADWANGFRPHVNNYIFARSPYGLALHQLKFRLLTKARQIKRKRDGTLSEID